MTSYADALTSQLRQQIMAEEDRRIFEALDAIASQCSDEPHPGYGKPVADCDHPECVVRSVLES